MDILGAIAEGFAESGVVFSSSRGQSSSGPPAHDQVEARITCRLSYLGKWEIIQQACTTMVSHHDSSSL